MELAGFDVILELHADTFRDALNTQALDLGNGQRAYLLGGRFAIDMPDVNVPGRGTAAVWLICEAAFEPVARSADCILRLTISGASVRLGPYVVTMLEAAASVTATIVFQPHPYEWQAAVYPGLDLEHARTTFELAAQSKSKLASVFGVKDTDAIELAIRAEFYERIHTLGVKTGGAFHFTVVPGVDSSDIWQISAHPQVMWIDAQTLGVFGYHRAAAQGGNLDRKNDSDIFFAGQEFFYDQPGLFSVVEARRMALLLSPDGFKQTLACPLVASEVVAPYVAKLARPELRDDERRVSWDDTYYPQALSHLYEYLEDERRRDGNQADPTADEAKRALDRVHQEAERLLDEATDARVQQWLVSWYGRQAIIVATPAPCGTGVLTQRIDLPDPFPGETATIYSLALSLNQGFILVSVEARCPLPLCESVQIRQEFELRVYVDQRGAAFVPPLRERSPEVHVYKHSPDCGEVLNGLMSALTGGDWVDRFSFLAIISVRSLIENTIRMELRQKTPLDLQQKFSLTSLPEGMRLRDIRIEPSGIAVIGLMAREFHWNEFEPRVTLTPTQLGRTRTARRTEEHEVTLPPTAWGCKGGTFRYSERWYDSRWRVAITITDLQPPVTATSWTIELGHRTFLFAGVPDPRPLWSTEIFPLVGPSLTIDAFVEYDEPVPNGRIEQRSIVIEVDGDAQSAMELAFRGDDGNLFVLVGVSVIDGSGAAYAAAAVFDVHGEEVEFSEGYSDYVADCQAKGSAWFATKLKSLPPQVRGQDLPPWAPVWDPDVAEAILLHRALRSDTVTAAAALESARERGLEGIIDRVRELPMNMRW